jgi:hypothetical protein
MALKIRRATPLRGHGHMDTGIALSSFTALQSALSGIQTSYGGLEKSAREIASATDERSESIELVEPLVHALEEQRALEASANVLRRADEALGTLIDTFA